MYTEFPRGNAYSFREKRYQELGLESPTTMTMVHFLFQNDNELIAQVNF